MTAQVLSGLAGAILSLAFSYLPGAAGWFDTLTPTQRRLFMAALMFVVAVGAVAYQCKLQQNCLISSWQDYATTYFTALVANQSVYSVSPQPTPQPPAK
jgi:hypothetical protein